MTQIPIPPPAATQPTTMPAVNVQIPLTTVPTTLP
jgi:hypothetical protein